MRDQILLCLLPVVCCLACRLSPVACRLSPVACRLSPVFHLDSGQILKIFTSRTSQLLHHEAKSKDSMSKVTDDQQQATVGDSWRQATL